MEALALLRGSCRRRVASSAASTSECEVPAGILVTGRLGTAPPQEACTQPRLAAASQCRAAASLGFNNALFECQTTEAARARYRDALDLDACDMRCLMDKVYQQKDVRLVLDFVYEASNLIPGPTA